MVHFLFSTLREWIRYLVYIIIQKSEKLKVLLRSLGPYFGRFKMVQFK